MASERKRGWWYPYIFVGGFVVVITVNGAMAYFATSTFTGLETEQAYDKGLAYNENIALAKAQAALGWTVDLTAETLPGAEGRKAAVKVSYRDRQGRPVEGLTVRATVTRPTSKGHDQVVALPAAAPGLYGVTVDVPLEGVWDFDVVALGNAGAYEFGKRVVLR